MGPNMTLAEAKPNLFWGRANDISDAKARRVWRTAEMLPGILSIGTFVLLIAFSFTIPAFVAFFIILFDLVWLIRAFSLSAHLIVSYRKVKRAMSEDWMKKLDTLRAMPPELAIASWRDIRHLVILPMYKEPRDVVEETLRALAESSFPPEQLFVVIATEARAGEGAARIARDMAEKFSHAFGRLIYTTHPSDIEGEIAGKGSNEAWAAREAVRTLVAPHGIDERRVIVSSFDIDTRIYPHYFACLTYTFLTAKKPLRSSYQPIPLYNNNIWDAPIFSRLVATGNSIWQMVQQIRPEQMETFSSHAMSLDALTRIGYWNTKVVSEDSLIFYQALLAFDGDYRVEPLLYPVSLDSNIADNFFKTAVNVYRQQRRWAYGIEKIPYLIYGFSKTRGISPWRKAYHLWVILDGFWSWACAAPMIFLFGWLPVIAGGVQFQSSVLAANLPYITSFMLNVAMLGMVINGIITFLLLPARPKGKAFTAYLPFVVQWALLPIVIIFLGSLPALDAQMRMLFGKYMGFWVTPKGSAKK